MTTDVEPIETTAIVVSDAAAAPALFGTTDPAEHIARAVTHAKALKDVIQKRGLIADIQGKKYVLYDGWALLASMVGASIVEDWTRPLPDKRGWEARMLVIRSGQIIGAAENMCTRDERPGKNGRNRWADADDYALRSMAQTRAGAKAARTCLGFIVQLAGYEATPYDEMPLGEHLPLEEQGAQIVEQRQRGPKCPEHGPLRYQPGGVSAKSGNAYPAFWGCTKSCTAGENGKSYFIRDADWMRQQRGEA